MAHPWTVGYDDDLTAEEHAALAEHDELFASAFQCSHYWQLTLDSKGRRHVRALGYTNRDECYAQFSLQDLNNVVASHDLTARLLAGDFAYQELQ